MYYIAIYYELEGWRLSHYEDLNDVKKVIMAGETYGRSFKVFKELNIKIEVKENEERNN